MRKFVRFLWKATKVCLLVLLVLLVGGAIYQVFATHRGRNIARAGKSVPVASGRNIYISCTGTGSPTVVLESALGAPSVLWEQIQPAVAQSVRVCSYDRDGIGWSDESGQPRTADHITGDLYAALHQAGEKEPFVLVGHSLGGMLAVDYAAHYPNEVAGLVLIDPTHPNQFAEGGDGWNTHKKMLPVFRSSPYLARAGLIRGALWLTDKLKPLPLSATTRGTYLSLMATTKATRAMASEAEGLFQLCRDSKVRPDLGNKPVVVLSAGRSLQEGYPVALHQGLAALSTNGKHEILEGATHSGIVLKPELAKICVQRILAVAQSK